MVSQTSTWARLLHARIHTVSRGTRALATRLSAERSSPSNADAGKRRVDRLPISDASKQSLLAMGITKLFDIQAKSFDPILRGRNFVGRSRTGTGKTVAYLLPALERMRLEKMVRPHSVIILLPTRELCRQVGTTLLALAGASAEIALVYGGPAMGSQEQLVRLGAKIIVATPGRCARLIERKAIEVENVRIIVVDEADVMLGEEYRGRVEKVLDACEKGALQRVLFSASLPHGVMKMLGDQDKSHQIVDLVDYGTVRVPATVQTVAHYLCKVPEASNQRTQALLHILEKRLSDRGRCIIFTENRQQANSIYTHPNLRRTARMMYQGDNKMRDSVLAAFASREFDVLIATDVVARGIDFEDVSLVLQLHPPRDASQYVHRAGRTGRAGARGVCVLLYDPSEQSLVNRVREETRQDFGTERAPGPAEMHEIAVHRLLAELLAVRPEEYEPLLSYAESMMDGFGAEPLATALAVLDGRHADLDRVSRESPSMLSGKPGFVALQVHDNDRETAPSDADVRRIVGKLLPRASRDAAIGQVVATETGWILDMKRHRALALLGDLRAGRQESPVGISIARSMPRIVRKANARARRIPWAAQQRHAHGRRPNGSKADKRPVPKVAN